MNAAKVQSFEFAPPRHLSRVPSDPRSLVARPPQLFNENQFERVLASATSARPLTGLASKDRTQDLRDAATELVSTAFIQPLLASRYDLPWADSGPFAPGTAEKHFRPLLDQQLADRVTLASGFDLVDAIVKRFSAHLDARASSTLEFAA